MLTSHPGVSQAFEVGITDDRWGEIGCAWVVAEPDTEVSAEEPMALCRTELARFKVPRHILFTAAEDFPTTPTGKVHKFHLVQRAEQQLQG